MRHKGGMNRDQLFFTSLSDMLPEDSFARIIDIFVDYLPLEELGFKHVELNTEGNEPYHPRDIFKLLVYGQRYGLRSANKLSRQCEINLEVRWLLRGLEPSSRTICYFRQDNGKAIKEAHKHFVRILKNSELILGELVALDSTKMRGQNSLKNNFNQKKIDRHLEYIDNKIEEYLNELCDSEDEPGKRGELESRVEELEKRRAG